MPFDNLLNIVTGVFNVYVRQAPTVACLMLVFTVWTAFESQAANPAQRWWRNKDLPIDICFGLLNVFLGPYLMIPALLVFIVLCSGVMTAQQTVEFFATGHGPLGVLSFGWQLVAYIVISDFLAYWSHRIFHTAHLWRFHAAHHSAEEIDWTTSYRFHPVDLSLEHLSITVIVLMLGISADAIAYLAPMAAFTAAWQHSNSNWTLGPLKYVFVTPVMHRWHHSPPDEGGNSNFGKYFVIWDYAFGTFYMPEGRLPQKFGVDDMAFPKDHFIDQLAYPFKSKPATEPLATVKAS